MSHVKPVKLLRSFLFIILFHFYHFSYDLDRNVKLTVGFWHRIQNGVAKVVQRENIKNLVHHLAIFAVENMITAECSFQPFSPSLDCLISHRSQCPIADAIEG